MRSKTKSIEKKVVSTKNVDEDECVNLDSIGEISKIGVAVNGKDLPFKIGDKIEFPDGNSILKTIAAIQINENGIETYLLEWFEEDAFKQYWISLTELKILKDNMKKRKVVSFSEMQKV